MFACTIHPSGSLGLIVRADAFDLDEFPADVVYLYRPLVRDDDEARLEDHVIRGMIPGSLLYLATTEPPRPLERVGQRLWRV